MAVVNVNEYEDKTVFIIYDPLRYGVKDLSWEVEIPHDEDLRSKLPKITKKELENLPYNKYEHKEMEKFQVPKVTDIIFIKHYLVNRVSDLL